MSCIIDPLETFLSLFSFVKIQETVRGLLLYRVNQNVSIGENADYLFNSVQHLYRGQCIDSSLTSTGAAIAPEDFEAAYHAAWNHIVATRAS
jgi:hypothetical protein